MTKTAALDFTAMPESPKVRAARIPKAAVHEYNNQDSRLAAVAADNASRPDCSIMVAPDRAVREELTHLARDHLYSRGQLGREALAVTILVEKEAGSLRRAESYEPGDKIHFKTGSNTDNIPHDSQATVLSTADRHNLITLRIDTTQLAVTFNPAHHGNQTRESRLFQEEAREIAEGERIRFTRYDKEMGVRSGDLGTVARIGQDSSMAVQLDSGKATEVSREKSRHIDYGYRPARNSLHAAGGLRMPSVSPPSDFRISDT